VKLAKKHSLRGLTNDSINVEFNVGENRYFILEVNDDVYDFGVVDIPQLSGHEGYFSKFTESGTSEDVETFILEVKAGKFDWAVKIQKELFRLQTEYGGLELTQIINMTYEFDGGYKS